jgi:hypothetical protein
MGRVVDYAAAWCADRGAMLPASLRLGDRRAPDALSAAAHLGRLAAVHYLLTWPREERPPIHPTEACSQGTESHLPARTGSTDNRSPVRPPGSERVTSVLVVPTLRSSRRSLGWHIDDGRGVHEEEPGARDPGSAAGEQKDG